jgi:hypothetical protein
LGYDLITGKILKELPLTGIKYVTQLFNALLLKGHFPAQWRAAAHNILIFKPGKPPNELTSYQPVSLLLTAYQSSFQIHREALHNRTNTSDCTKYK